LPPEFLDERAPQADQRVKHTWRRCIPDLGSVNPRGKLRQLVPRRRSKRLPIVRARRRKHSIMPRHGSAHPQVVKKPRTNRRQQPRLKIEMEKGLRFRLLSSREI
jgi:hypothetical protein